MDAKGNTHICKSPVVDNESVVDVDESRPRYLIVVDGGLPGTMFQLNETGVRLGRSAENSIQFIETTISRRHAYFSVDINGQVGLTDLGSSNGTYLNNQRLQPHSPVWVRNGDRIRIGTSIVLKFVRLDPEDERFQRELFERIVRDSLTGLFNRGYFLEQIGPLEARCTEAGLGLAVMLVDIDHFKKVNDSYGHNAGDLVLRDVSQVLRELTRPDDLVARYGGEEFVIAIPVALAEPAHERADRIRRQIGERRIRFQNHELRATVSLGMAFSQPNSNRCPISLITEADLALYRAKREGRDRVNFNPDPFVEFPTDSRSQETASSRFAVLS